MLSRNINFWYGSTITDPYAPLFVSAYHNTFVSIEPILAPFGTPDYPKAEWADWVIMGAETGNRTGKAVPKRSWIEDAVKLFQESNIPVFMKDSMKPIWGEDILTEFPWID